MDAKQIFDIFLYMSECLVFFYYAQAFFEKRYSTLVTLLSCTAGYILLLFTYRTGSVIINAVCILLVQLLLFMILYKCKLGSALFHSTLLLVLIMATEWIVIFATTKVIHCDFYAFMDNLDVYVLVTILNKLAYYIVCILIIKLFSKKFKSQSSDPLFFALMVIPVASVVLIIVLNELTINATVSDSLALASSIAAIFLLFANIIVFLVYEYSITNAAELTELKTEQRKAETDKMYLEILEKNNADLRIFTHDMKNHLQLIESLSEDEEIKQYIDEMYGSVEKFSFVGMSKNRVFDIIISKYLTLCEKSNVGISFDVKTANLSGIKDIDLSTILNNLLDNAVRAASNSKDKKVAVSVYKKNDAFEVLQIVNSCDVAPKTRGGNLITTKEDKENHGLGTKSVKRIAKKYDATFEWEYKEDTHEFETLLIFK